MDPKKFKTKDDLTQILMHVKGTDKMLKEIKSDFYQLNQMVTSHSVSIKHLDTPVGLISTQLNARPKGGLPNDTVVNPK